MTDGLGTHDAGGPTLGVHGRPTVAGHDGDDPDDAEGHIRVLLVEDDEDDYVATRAMLEEAEHIGVELHWADSVERARELIESDDYDVLLVDHRLGASTGLDFVRAATEIGVRGPFILLTGLHDGRIDDDALRAGVADHLVKGDISPSRLERSIRHTLRQARLVEELERARELKDHFLSHVSHELRTPLAAVHQFVSIVFDGLAGELREEQHNYLQIALRNVDQLAKMVDDLLEATRAQTGKLSVDLVRVPVAAMIDAVRADYEQRAIDAQVELTVDVADDLVVRADPARIHQVLSNLVDNALRFTPAGGRIAISARRDTASSAAVVSVVDTGIGMDASDRDVIFERHGQVDGPLASAHSRRGLGLGLFICRQLVELHDGRIWVESEPGAGSAFSFALPLWSLDQVVGPAIARMMDTDGVLVLVRVGISLRGTTPDRRRQMLARARKVIDDFTLPYDVVVPTTDPADGAVYLLAPVTERNVTALTARISAELERHLRQSEAQPGWRIAFARVELPHVATAAADDVSATAAARIEALVETPDDARWSPVERNTDGQAQGTHRR